MFPLLIAVILTSAPDASSPSSGRTAAKALIETIETLQDSIEDFRCEYEGTSYFMGKVAEDMKGRLAEDGLLDSFGGIFIWRRGGDLRDERFNRFAFNGKVARETLVIRMKTNEAEQYRRMNDAGLGSSSLMPASKARPDLGGFGILFLRDALERKLADPVFAFSVADDTLEGRPLKTLAIGFQREDGTEIWIERYWIDLRRNGHVVRVESYMGGGMASRLDVTLAPFKVKDAEVWMPVSGEVAGYAALVDKKPVVTEEPTSRVKVYATTGSMEFNRHPGREVFTIKYKLGTPISDQVRKLSTIYGEQKIDPVPTRAEAEKMLKAQTAEADAQKSALVAVPPSEGFAWSTWAFRGFGVLVVGSISALAIQRYRR